MKDIQRHPDNPFWKNSMYRGVMQYIQFKGWSITDQYYEKDHNLFITTFNGVDDINNPLIENGDFVYSLGDKNFNRIAAIVYEDDYQYKLNHKFNSIDEFIKLTHRFIDYHDQFELFNKLDDLTPDEINELVETLESLR